MPSKNQWEKWVHKAWYFTKVLFALITLMVGSYFYGTYSPNKTAIAEVNAELDIFYMNKIEEMDLQEPEFTYVNETQFIRAMHKCINYVNFTTPKHLRVPYEMILGQAALESGWGTSRFGTEANNLFGIKGKSYHSKNQWWDGSIQDANTEEVYDGKRGTYNLGFRKYKSPYDSIKDHNHLLMTKSRYKPVRDAETPEDQAHALKAAGYATGENYAETLISIIEKLQIIIFYIFVNVTRNLIYLITIPLLIYIIIVHKIKNITKFISCFFILNLAFVVATYLFKMDEVELLIKASMDRVLFQTSGIYLLIIVIFVNNYLSLSNKYKIK